MVGDKPRAARGEHVPERPRDSVKATLSKVAAAEYMTRNRNCPRMAAGSVQDMMRTRTISGLCRFGAASRSFAKFCKFGKKRVVNTEDLHKDTHPAGLYITYYFCI